MSLFSRKKDPQRLFDPTLFTVTETVFEPPAFTLAPSIYRDASRRRWAVCYKGAQPSLFDYADVVECAVVEDQAGEKNAGLGGKGLLKKIVANPSEVSRANAARRGMCTGLSVVVAVRSAAGLAKLEIPIITSELRRDSPLFDRMVLFAQQIKSTFDAMKAEA